MTRDKFTRAPDDLASQAAAAVAAQGLGLRMVERLLQQTTVTADSMGSFGTGSPLFDTTVMSIKQTVAGAGPDRALVVDLGNGDQWWSTRLYLLASLLHSLTSVRQIVFRQASGRFAGMASPSAVIDGLAAAFPQLEEFRRLLRTAPASQDTQRETDRQIGVWNMAPLQPEDVVKVGVRPELLPVWIGDRLVTRCIKVDENGPTMAQVQQIVESLLPDVPIERSPSPPEDAPVLQVVDRDAFALELAREWVRSALPRTPVH